MLRRFQGMNTVHSKMATYSGSIILLIKDYKKARFSSYLI